MSEPLEIHPIAEAFPWMDKKDIQELADDITANGQVMSIVLYEGKILDGRNRYAACQLAGVAPKTRVYDGIAPIAYAWSLNGPRRHMTTSQRAVVAAKLADLKHGDEKRFEKPQCFPKPPKDGLGKTNESLANSTENIAESLKVSPRSVERARAVAKESPEKFAEVAQGKKTVGKALKEIAEEKEKPKVETAPVDEFGTVIPSDCLPNWQRGVEVRAVLSEIRALKTKIDGFKKSKDPLWARIHFQNVEIQLQRLSWDVGAALPYAVCPYCQGRTKIKCKMCLQWGIISKFHYQAVPSELRKDKQ